MLFSSGSKEPHQGLELVSLRPFPSAITITLQALPVDKYIYTCISLCLSICVSVSVCLYVCVYPPVYQSNCNFVYHCRTLNICVSVSMCASLRPPWLFVYLYVCVFTVDRLFACIRV